MEIRKRLKTKVGSPGMDSNRDNEWSIWNVQVADFKMA
jgi:hypothetical protein